MQALTSTEPADKACWFKYAADQQHTSRVSAFCALHCTIVIQSMTRREYQMAGESHHLLSSTICSLLLQIGHFPPQARQQSELGNLPQICCMQLSLHPLSELLSILGPILLSTQLSLECVTLSLQALHRQHGIVKTLRECLVHN